MNKSSEEKRQVLEQSTWYLIIIRYSSSPHLGTRENDISWFLCLGGAVHGEWNLQERACDYQRVTSEILFSSAECSRQCSIKWLFCQPGTWSEAHPQWTSCMSKKSIFCCFKTQRARDCCCSLTQSILTDAWYHSVCVCARASACTERT